MSAVLNLENVVTGMTDAELEMACEETFSGISPCAHWSSEIYSFGKCLRFWARYPSFLPLYVYSDHGAGLHSRPFPHELENQAKVHLTWHPVKEQRNKDFADKKMLRIIHPWISYRRFNCIRRSKQHKGTLVFFTHHVPGIKWANHDTDDYFVKLKQLPEKFHPVVLCVHMHDIHAGHHKKLRHYGFQIVTAGHTSSVNFVDRFYDLIKNYSYATSNIWGSHIAYCVELGLPYFFLGECPKLINISHEDMSLGEVTHQDELDKEYEKQAEILFRLPVDVVTTEQRAFVESLLGVDSKVTRKQVSWILWREFFRNWLKWPSTIKYLLISFLRKIGCLELIKKYLQCFKGGKL